MILFASSPRLWDGGNDLIFTLFHTGGYAQAEIAALLEYPPRRAETAGPARPGTARRPDSRPGRPGGRPGRTHDAGDPRGTADRRVREFVVPFGWFGDPLLGLAKFWTYDCCPFVHSGFVEWYLYEKGVTKRGFAPRLALRALWTLQRELPVPRPTEGPEYWDSLVALLRHALDSLD